MHLDDVQNVYVILVRCRNVYRQEEKEDDEQARTGEDLCHPSAYNRRLRATQSPNYRTKVFMSICLALDYLQMFMD